MKSIQFPAELEVPITKYSDVGNRSRDFAVNGFLLNRNTMIYLRYFSPPTDPSPATRASPGRLLRSLPCPNWCPGCQADFIE